MEIRLRPAGVLALALCRLASADPAPVAASEYRELITVAARGDARSAVKRLLDWPADRIGTESQRLPRMSDCSSACLRTAVLLHTEAAFLSRYAGQGDVERAHFRAADHVADAAAPRDGPPGDTAFDRRWRLAVAYLRQQWIELYAARDTYEKMIHRHPEDAETLVALGTLREHVIAAPALAVSSPLVSLRDAWGAPQSYYERALALRPDFVEARLRLGRVALMRGRHDDARRELSAVVAAGRPSSAVAFAHLFLGECAAAESQAAAAIDHYRAALQVDPALQPAQLALARALQQTGRGAEALAALREGLRHEEPTTWFAYHTSALHGYRESMNRLWEEVQR